MTAKINIKNGDTFAVQASVSGVTVTTHIKNVLHDWWNITKLHVYYPILLDQLTRFGGFHDKIMGNNKL